jgi:hypothetical protein
MTDDALNAAAQAERLGDAADIRESAAAHYREAQRLFMPVGAVWTDRVVYDRCMEAFERIQQKIYGLEAKSSVPPAPAEPTIPESEAPVVSSPPAITRELTVWDFSPGLVVRVCQDFTDYDGQVIHAGEVLHFLDSSYFPYESGHTLRFAEKTIRLAGIVDEHEPIIANPGNAWFQPLT